VCGQRGRHILCNRFPQLASHHAWSTAADSSRDRLRSDDALSPIVDGLQHDDAALADVVVAQGALPLQRGSIE
jgi:hypothetical protein